MDINFRFYQQTNNQAKNQLRKIFPRTGTPALKSHIMIFFDNLRLNLKTVLRKQN